MMIRRPTVAVALCLLLLAFASRPARADLVLTLEPSQTSPLNVGDTFSVDVYLDDLTAGNPDPTDSPLNGSGLGSYTGLWQFGFTGKIESSVFSLPPANAFQVGPNLSGNLSTSAPAGGLTFFTVTGSETTPDSQTGAYGTAMLDSFSNVIGYRLKLGTIYFEADGPSASSTIELSDVSNSPEFVISGSASDADVFGAAPYSAALQVNAVPEPGSMSLVALSGGGLWLVRRRLRRAK